VAASEKEVERKKCQGKMTSRQTAGNRKGCQDSAMSRANGIKRKWHHQTRGRERRNVKQKEFQELTQSTAVTARRSGFVPAGSPFIDFAPIRNFRHPACPSSTGI
jgi:hypothetical protein